MEKKRNRFVIWIVALIVAALVLTDLAPMFVEAHEPVTLLPPLAVSAAAPVAAVHVAQDQAQPPKKKRRTLMDLLFGDKEEKAPVVAPAQPKATTPKVASVPAKPVVEKSPTATRLAVMGDSMAGDVANALTRFYAEDPNLVVVPMGAGSSGFVRPDFFDWNQTAADAISGNTFDLAVMIVGINDKQTLTVDGQSYKALTEPWAQIYRARLNDFVGKFRAAGKPLIWIGMPPMQQPSYSQAISQISAIQRLAAFAGGAEFLDIYDRFVDEGGAYSAFGPDLNGQRVRMRKDDGIHFSAGGADKLAFYLSQSIKLFYRGGGGVSFEVADPLGGTDAQLMLRPPYQGLGQIRMLEIAGAVVPLTQEPKRAASLLTAAGTAVAGTFDSKLLVDAPIGRADAFGVGKAPETEPAGGP